MMALLKKTANVHVRWMTPKDVDEMMQIEYSSFEDVWTAEEFKKLLAKKPCVGFVAYQEPPGKRSEILGYMVYVMSKTGFELLKLAVHPDHRQKGVGKTLAAKLFDKLKTSYRSRVEVVVRERNVPAQKFFRTVGLRAEKCLKRHFRADEDLKLAAEDGIVFGLTVPLDDVLP